MDLQEYIWVTKISLRICQYAAFPQLVALAQYHCEGIMKVLQGFLFNYLTGYFNYWYTTYYRAIISSLGSLMQW